MISRFICIILALFCLVLPACKPFPEQPVEHLAPAVPEDFPDEIYRAALENGQPVYGVDHSRSLVTVRVYRDGKLASLGHDHVVASHHVGGWVLWGELDNQRRADLYVPVDQLTMDEPALRTRFGLENNLTSADVEGTRQNMLNHTLRSGENPFVILHVTTAHLPVISVQITVNGVTKTQRVTADIRVSEQQLTASGQFSLRQSDYGMVPFSALGGLLLVKDEVDVHFDLVSKRHHSLQQR